MTKPIIYQIFTRLYSNTNPTRLFDGDISANGSGKFNDINHAALDSIAQMGFTHVWYTGIVRHASVTRYPFATRHANANVVKGKAGSPYAICDYYDVDPDLAQQPDLRMQEFEALVERTHSHGMKCIIDFVPNHVARNYHSDAMPDTPQLGEADDTNCAFSPQNNFYYIPGQSFVPPCAHKDAPYEEHPAKASGNDAFTPAPSINDWYETVKLNYGIDYSNGSRHFSPTPDTWRKMRDILMFWASKGIDGFRVDMAEMVPVEFWQWVIIQVKTRHPKVIFVAETYNLSQYREYIAAGFDYLYDKVNFYDTVRDVICQRQPAIALTNIWRRTEGINKQMLYFLENHDEQRIASDFFAGNATAARPGMMLAATFGGGATMVYFGQELGERGMDHEGFSGRDGRTTIFDYWGIELFQQYVNHHRYDGALLPIEAQELRQWHAQLLRLAKENEAFAVGELYDLMWVNEHLLHTAPSTYAYLRHTPSQRMLVALNFGPHEQTISVRIPRDAWQLMGIADNQPITPAAIFGGTASTQATTLQAAAENGIQITVPPYGGTIATL